jgi:uncharacterized protein YbjT (DUF2867 family)
MKILICGARGFIGKAIAERLTSNGHQVIKGVRHAGGTNEVSIDFSRDHAVDDWLPRLQGVDVVINAVGILVELAGQKFDDIHRKAPQALFAACVKAGVKRVVQISALGTDTGNTGYFRSKRAADEFLMAQPLDWQILRPALVYGPAGDSAQFFRMLASLPVVGLPAGGHQIVQPIHIDDLVQGVLPLVESPALICQCVDFVGAEPIEYRDMLSTYRAAMGFSPSIMIGIPAAVMRFVARVLDFVPGAMLNSETWQMLQEGNAGDTGNISILLGRRPRRIKDFIGSADAGAIRAQALAAWHRPLLCGVLALVWIVSGLVSMFAYPASASFELLARVGLTGAIASLVLYGAAVFDVVLGVATLLKPSRGLWLIQALTIAVYSLIVIVGLPEYLIHPFGPILKNLPILAILVILFSEEIRS